MNNKSREPKDSKETIEALCKKYLELVEKNKWKSFYNDELSFAERMKLLRLDFIKKLPNDKMEATPECLQSRDKFLSSGDEDDTSVISIASLGKYERGAGKPGYDALKKIHDFYDVSYDFLFGETLYKNNTYLDVYDKTKLNAETVDALNDAISGKEGIDALRTNIANFIIRECMDDIINVLHQAIVDMTIYNTIYLSKNQLEDASDNANAFFVELNKDSLRNSFKEKLGGIFDIAIEHFLSGEYDEEIKLKLGKYTNEFSEYGKYFIKVAKLLHDNFEMDFRNDYANIEEIKAFLGITKDDEVQK